MKFFKSKYLIFVSLTTLLIGISSCEEQPTSCSNAKVQVTNHTGQTIYYTWDNGQNQDFLYTGQSTVYTYGQSSSSASSQNFKYKYEYEDSWKYSINMNIDDCMNYYSVD